MDNNTISVETLAVEFVPARDADGNTLSFLRVDINGHVWDEHIEDFQVPSKNGTVTTYERNRGAGMKTISIERLVAYSWWNAPEEKIATSEFADLILEERGYQLAIHGLVKHPNNYFILNEGYTNERVYDIQHDKMYGRKSHRCLVMTTQERNRMYRKVAAALAEASEKHAAALWELIPDHVRTSEVFAQRLAVTHKVTTDKLIKKTVTTDSDTTDSKARIETITGLLREFLVERGVDADTYQQTLVAVETVVAIALKTIRE